VRQLPARNWYRIENTATDAVIRIDDYVGRWRDASGDEFGVSAKAFIDDLNKLPASVSTIRVHINSLGGDVGDGLAIANALRAHRLEKRRRVETIVDGIAASIASVIAMAGEPNKIADSALLMIHLPWKVTVGNQADHLASAAALEKITTGIITAYRWHTTIPEDAVRDLMTAETWMTADEAIALGFVQEKTPATPAAAAQAMAMVDRQQRVVVPDKYRARLSGRKQLDSFGWHQAIRADRPVSKFLRTL
jgi:ATP-dependent protease ClpP protease subunit